MENIFAFTIIIIFLSLFQLVCSLPAEIRIGGLFDSYDETHEVAFISAVQRINKNRDILPNSRLLAQVERIPPHDSFEASRRVCSLMSIGVAAIFGPQSADTSAHVQSICDALDVPHIETRLDVGLKKAVYSINLYPHPPTLSKAYEDLIHHWNWKTFAILYENNDGLIRLRDLFRTATRSVYNIGVRKLPQGDDYRNVLREFKKLGHTNIIIDCDTDNVFRVLKQAQQIGMMTDQHHYLVTSLESIDLDTVDLEDFRYGGTNITSLRLVDPNRPEVVRVVSTLQSSDNQFGRTGSSKHFLLKTETALIFDAVYLFAKALHDLDSSQHIDVKPLSCDSEEPWVPGNSLINYMKVVQMDGLSGIVGFDNNRFRSHFALDIVELQKTGLTTIGFWSSDFKDKKLIGLNISYAPEEVSDGLLKSKKLNVTTLMSKPYTMIKDSTDHQTGNNRYEGYCIDLIDEIAKLLEFNYTIYEVEDGVHGVIDNVTKEWTGIIGAVRRGKADVGIGDITITLAREEAVDFTTPFMNLGISILFRKPLPAPPSLLSFLSPFSNDVWLYMCITYMGVSLVLFILARLSPYEWDNPYPCIQDPDVLQNDFGLMNSMWFTIGSLMQQGSDIAPKAASTRLVAGIWWLFTLIMISSYTANLAAFLTVENKETQIENVNQLARQSKIKYGCMRSGSTRTFFEQSNIPIYQSMWSVMVSNEWVFTMDNKFGEEKVKKRKDYAFFMESNSIEYITERQCELMQVGGLLDSKGYGIALPKGSPYRNEISAAILQLQEKGTLHALKTKWWKQKRGGGQCKDTSSSNIKPLGLSNVGGIFVVLLAGMGIACLAAAAEFIWKTQKVASHERGSLYQEMVKELKFAMSCKSSKKLAKKSPSEPENGLTMPLSKYSFNDRDIFT